MVKIRNLEVIIQQIKEAMKFNNENYSNRQCGYILYSILRLREAMLEYNLS